MKKRPHGTGALIEWPAGSGTWMLRLASAQTRDREDAPEDLDVRGGRGAAERLHAIPDRQRRAAETWDRVVENLKVVGRREIDGSVPRVDGTGALTRAADGARV